MSDLATVDTSPSRRCGASRQKDEEIPRHDQRRASFLALVIGLGFIGFNIAQDFNGVAIGSIWPYLLLIRRLLIALGFEFVNGFHDTANAVATVIYTHSLDPNIAVVWSGLCNLTGVLLSSGAVAFAIITLLPVELILQVSSGAGFAMVFACSSPPSSGT
jgi:inorganic phosphate transporter, PiT family